MSGNPSRGAPTTPHTSTPGEALPAIEVGSIELVRVALPLIRPFRTSFGVQTARDVLLVRVATAAGVEGWGECVTPAAPVYSEEFTDGAARVLTDHLVPRLLHAGRTAARAEDVGPELAGFKGNRMAKAALETAVLDAQLRTADRSLADNLGATASRVPVGVSVGIPDGGVAELIDQIAGYLDEGYLRIKAKVMPGFDAEEMAAVREHFGDGLAIQVDANAGYDPDDPGHREALDGLDECGLIMIEQPFGADRLADHAEAATRWRTPICLDESITDAVRARDAIDAGATSIVNIKPGRVGGLLESVRIHDICVGRGIPVWCGGMLESGVGRAAAVALSALPGFRLPGDTSASSRYYAQDITEPFVLEDGHLAVPRGAGIGRQVDLRGHADVRRDRIDA